MKKERFEMKMGRIIAMLTAIVAVLVIFGGQTSFAQIVRRKPPIVKIQNKQVFKGIGINNEDPKIANLKEMAKSGEIKLTDVSKSLAEAMNENGFNLKVDGTMPVEKFADLSIQVPMVYQKAIFEFYKPYTVNPRVNGAMFTANESTLRINLKPNVSGKWFAVTCFVSPSAGAYTIFGPDGSKAEVFAESNGLLHTFVLSQNTDWQSLLIRRFSKDANDFWYLSTCSITTPKLP